MANKRDIKIIQHISTKDAPEAWEVGWTESRGIKNTRWIEMFETFERAVKFVKDELGQ